ncbi:MAG: hypothetical protein QOG90_2200 [Actinomycetota bacterium]
MRSSRTCDDCCTRHGPASGNWRGGKTRTKKGYILMRALWHPRAPRNSGGVFEHILVMEAALGRYLHPDETVHHRNGVKDDNRLENLELWVRPQHSGIRSSDAMAWARDIVARYGEESTCETPVLASVVQPFEADCSWRGFQRRHKAGYAVVYAPWHPRTSAKTTYVFEHILVMEESLGRYLLPDETIHHVNGVKDDNRLENLELWVRPQPAGIRASDALTWAKTIIARYENVPSDESNAVEVRGLAPLSE